MTKLYRSRRDSKITGLCGGLAEQLNVDSTLLRLIVVVTTFFSAGTVIPIYIIAAMVIPKEPHTNVPPMYPPYGGGGYSSYGGQGQPHNNGYNSPYGSSAGQPNPGQYRAQSTYYPGTGAPQRETAASPAPSAPSIDDMMKDVEKKAMQKEIEELRAKVAKYEKGE